MNPEVVIRMAKKEKEEKSDLPKLRFRADQKSPTLAIGNGDYRRQFEAKDQPFEVESNDEFQLLKGSGYFVVVPESKEEELNNAAPGDQAPPPQTPAGASTANSLDKKEQAAVKETSEAALKNKKLESPSLT
jgi:hypothetical protein